MKSYRRVDGRIGSGRHIHGGAAAFAFPPGGYLLQKIINKENLINSCLLNGNNGNNIGKLCASHYFY